MSWHFSRALAAESSAASSSAGALSAPSSETPTPAPSSRPGRTTDVLIRSQFGTTCERSRSGTTPCAASSASCAVSAIHSLSPADSRVRTSVAPGKVSGSTVRAPASGLSSPESFAKFDRASRSWRTPQCSLLEGLDEYSETWPRWGMMRDGECSAQSMPVHLTAGYESGYGLNWPTPTASSSENAVGRGKIIGKRVLRPTGQHFAISLASAVKAWPTPRAIDGRSATNNTTDGALQRSQATGFANLAESVQINNRKLWPTPQAQDSKQNGPRPKSAAVMLGQAVMFPDAIAERERDTIPTPCSTDWKGSMKDGQRRGQLTDPAQGIIPAGGALNPNWVEWLMNWPVGWTDLTKEAKHETEYWKAIGSTNLPSYGLREMWFNREAGAPSQGPEHGEQHARERGDSVPDVPPLGAYANQAGDLCDLRDGISPEEIQEIKALRGLAVRQDSRCEICRVAVVVVNRVDRLRCIGNGQVPAVVRLAWLSLAPETT